jgi:hypothetical protein
MRSESELESKKGFVRQLHKADPDSDSDPDPEKNQILTT